MSDRRALPRPRALPTILWGGAAVAVLDIANAMTFWGLYRGTPPRAILQSVAAGLLGRDAFTGGVPTALLGAFLHVFIATAVATGYVLACRVLPALVSRPVVAGGAYGAGVYLVMNFIVLPLSNARPVPFNGAWFLANFIGHVVLVGMPVAFIARLYSRSPEG